MKVSIIVPTFNEEKNIATHYSRTLKAISPYLASSDLFSDYEYIITDNASSDRTLTEALNIKENDHRVRVISNLRNYGPVLSPFNAIMLARGDIIVTIVADLQEPPELIPQLLRQWEPGIDAVIAQKQRSDESSLMWHLRGLYYKIFRLLGLIGKHERYGGFGAYSREFIELLRDEAPIDPNMRILVARYAHRIKAIQYQHEARLHGRSSYSIYSYIKESCRTIARSLGFLPELGSKISLIFLALSFGILIFITSQKIANPANYSPGILTIASLLLFCMFFMTIMFALVIDRLDLLIKLQAKGKSQVSYREY